MAIVAELLVAVGADVSAAERGLSAVDRGIDSVARGSDVAAPRFNGFAEMAIGGLRRIGEIAIDAGLRIGGALAGAGAGALDSAASYQQSMAVLRQSSGATGAEMASLGQLAQQLGADVALPGTSALDASQAMLELIKAGVSVSDTMDATRAVLQMSAAAGVDNATAAQITANALNTFGLQGKDAIRVSDMLAAAANASSASMTDLSQGIQQAGFAFDAAGMPIEDLTTAVAALTNVGLTGSDSGTALKNAIMRLFDPTKDAQGAMRDLGLEFYNLDGTLKQLPDIIGELDSGLAGLTDEQRNQALSTIFLSDGMKALLPLLDLGVDGFADLKAEVTAQGAAGETAAAMNSGLRGAMDGLSSTLETLGLVAAQPLLEPVERGIRLFTDAIGIATPSIVAFSENVIAPGINRVLDFANSFSGLSETSVDIGALFSSLATEAGAKLDEWRTALEPYAVAAGEWILNGATYLAENFLTWRNQAVEWLLSNLPGWMTALEPWAMALGQWVLDALPGLITNFTTATGNLIRIIGENAPGIINKLGEWGLAFAQWVVDAAPGLLRQLGSAVGTLLDAIGEHAPGIVESLAEWGAAFIEWAIEALPGLLRELGGMVDGILGWIAERVPGIAAKLGEWALAFVGWVLPALGDLLLNLGALFGEILIWATNKSPEFNATLAEWGKAFGDWIMRDAWPAALAGLGDLWNNISGWFTEKITAITQEGSLGRALWDAMFGGSHGAAPSVPGFASGVRNFGGGMAIVGERGPELVNLPRGSDVIPAGPTAAALASAGGTTVVVNLTVQGNVTAERDLQESTRQYIEEFIRRNN